MKEGREGRADRRGRGGKEGRAREVGCREGRGGLVDLLQTVNFQFNFSHFAESCAAAREAAARPRARLAEREKDDIWGDGGARVTLRVITSARLKEMARATSKVIVGYSECDG